MLESIVVLKPRDQWREGVRPEDIVREMESSLDLPGVQEAITMPIRARVDMLTTGIRTPVGVKVLGTDLQAIEQAGRAIENALRSVPGTRSVYAERQLAGVFVEVRPRRADLLRLGASVDDVMDVVDLGLSGMPVGRIVLGRERYGLIARFGRDFRADEEGIGRLPVRTQSGTVPLSSVADVVRTPGPAMLIDEGGQLAAYVYVDPGERDLGRYVDDARAAVAGLALPQGVSLKWTGQQEFLERAQARMGWMVPITIGLVFLLTWLALRTIGETTLVLLTLPFSVLGGIWFLALAGYNVSIATWVALIALIGVGAETGTVLAVYMDVGLRDALRRGEDLTPSRLAAIAADSSSLRLRGLVLAIAMNLFGLLPILMSRGVGSDLARRMAGPMFGGLLSLTFMTALVLPAGWVLWRRGQLRRGTLVASLDRSRVA
jgi:Cu(I)/Ag(I) efflux system membrane protein CusA/SilA